MHKSLELLSNEQSLHLLLHLSILFDVELYIKKPSGR